MIDVAWLAKRIISTCQKIKAVLAAATDFTVNSGLLAALY